MASLTSIKEKLTLHDLYQSKPTQTVTSDTIIQLHSKVSHTEDCRSTEGESGLCLPFKSHKTKIITSCQ